MVIYLPQLNADPADFPAPTRALTEPDGLLAMGGDLSVTRLYNAYQQGIFPWFSEANPLLWWSPSERALFAPNRLTVNRSLKKQLHKQQYRILLNQHFDEVIYQCSLPRAKQAGTWISTDMQRAYTSLHQHGRAHCVEVWCNDELIGGCYGVQVGQLFCGESMFNRQDNAAKIALCALQYHLQRFAAGWIDCQLMNPFLQQLGAQPIQRNDYLKQLNGWKQHPLPEQCWQPQELHESWWHV